MFYKVTRKVVDNVVQASVQVDVFDAQEKEAILRFGYPYIEVGGALSGSYTRTTQSAPTLTVVGDGSGAVLSETIDPETGAFEGVVVVDGGTDYTNAAIALSGHSVGSGATFTVEIASSPGPITGVTVVTPGADYVSDPVVVEFELPVINVLVKELTSIRQNFLFSASRNADLQALIFTNQVETKLQQAMDTLLNRKAEHLIETQKNI